MKELEQRADQLSRIWLQGQTIYKNCAKSMGLTDNFITVLYAIFRHPADCTQKYLVEKTLLPKQTIHFVISRLQKQDLIIRKPAENDSRIKAISLTSQGKKYIQQNIEPFVQDSQRAMASLSPHEQQLLVSLLGTFIDNLSEETGKNILNQ